jgi:hypothetical protein
MGFSMNCVAYGVDRIETAVIQGTTASAYTRRTELGGIPSEFAYRPATDRSFRRQAFRDGIFIAFSDSITA